MEDEIKKTETLQVRCEADLVQRINRQRRREDDPPTKSEMARILMMEALAAREAKQDREAKRGNA